MPSRFTLSNALADSMVLQRDRAVVWGSPGSTIRLTLKSQVHNISSSSSLSRVALVDAESSWRIALPPLPYTSAASALHFNSSDGGSAALSDVVFGDVFLCSGQSNRAIGPKPARFPVLNSSAVLASAGRP